MTVLDHIPKEQKPEEKMVSLNRVTLEGWTCRAKVGTPADNKGPGASVCPLRLLLM